MKKHTFLLVLLLSGLTFFSCKKDDGTTVDENGQLLDEYGNCIDNCDEDHADINLNEYIFQEDGETMLWGGSNDEWHFNISNLSLNRNNLKFGLGRESFVALMAPEYDKGSTVTILKDDDEMIVVYGREETKVFPIDLMVEHEVINDVIDGEPIMVAYCILADYVGVLSRQYCGQTFTFAVSGYTYFETEIWDGKNGFILWDRDTESLWWPLIGRAVSGGMINKALNTDIKNLKYERTSWGAIKNTPNLKVLRYNQEMEPPFKYPRVEACE